MGALGAAIKLASPDPRLNTIGRELALDRATENYRVEVLEHAPGVTNRTPDWLSRVAAPGRKATDELPKILRGVQRLEGEARTAAWWRTRSPPSAPGVASDKTRLPPGGEVGE